MSLDELTDAEIREEWRELRQIVGIVAASYPSQYLLGKTADRITDVCRRVCEGRPLIDKKGERK